MEGLKFRVKVQGGESFDLDVSSNAKGAELIGLLRQRLRASADEEMKIISGGKRVADDSTCSSLVKTLLVMR